MSSTSTCTYGTCLLTGSEGGLRLELNIEQYEYMRGPNPGAGLKLQIHNQNDVPLVKEHGLAVPPGSHGFVAIKTIEVPTKHKEELRWYRTV